ncbi:hypothetical protein BJX99DRAFT_114497 [Aspergillus californicus]
MSTRIFYGSSLRLDTSLSSFYDTSSASIPLLENISFEPTVFNPPPHFPVHLRDHNPRHAPYILMHGSSKDDNHCTTSGLNTYTPLGQNIKRPRKAQALYIQEDTSCRL